MPAFVEREDPALLLDDVQPRRLGRRGGDVHRSGESAGDADDAQLLPLATGPGDCRNHRQQDGERS